MLLRNYDCAQFLGRYQCPLPGFSARYFVMAVTSTCWQIKIHTYAYICCTEFSIFWPMCSATCCSSMLYIIANPQQIEVDKVCALFYFWNSCTVVFHALSLKAPAGLNAAEHLYEIDDCIRSSIIAAHFVFQLHAVSD